MRHAFPKQIQIEGTVTDMLTNRPIALVYVMRQSKAIATTDSLGHFSFYADSTEPNVRLAFRHINYIQTERSVNLAHAQETILIAMEPQDYALDDVVVQTPFDKIETNLLYSTHNIGKLDIKQDVSTSFIDVLEKVPGLHKKYEYHSPIVLRGLSGKRLLITKDGNRRMGNFPKGFMGENINIYNIEKIEVIKGPGSVKYGSGAMGGIINIESKSPFRQKGLHGKIETIYGTNNQEKTVMAGIDWNNDSHALSLNGKYCDADNFRYANREIAKNSYHTDKDVAASYQWRPSSRFALSIDNELHIGGPWGKPIGISGTDYITVVNHDDDTYHFGASAKWNPRSRAHKIHSSFFYDREYRYFKRDYYIAGSGNLSYTEETWYRDHYYGGKIADEYTPSSKLKLDYGIDFATYTISTPTAITDHYLAYHFDNRVSENAGVSLSGIYAESELKWNSKICNTAGVRVNYNSIEEGQAHDTAMTDGRDEQLWALNAILATKVEVLKDTYFTLNLARSYRTPDAYEMFIDNYGMNAITYANPDLEPEYGYNIDMGLRGKCRGITFDASTYYYFLHQLISTEIYSQYRGISYVYANIDRAAIRGGECTVSYVSKKIRGTKMAIYAACSAVLTYGNQIEPNAGWFEYDEALNCIPPFNSRQELKLKYQHSAKTSSYILADNLYFAKQRKIPEDGFSNEAYDLTGIGAGFAKELAKCRYSFRIKASNIFDNYYKAYESLIPGKGRNIKVFLALNF